MLDVAGKAGVADPSAAGPIEYLLIETSGLVDPTETVLALDKTFGKLARVRLDSVVCVVDAESAAAGGVLGPEAFAEAGGDARGGEDAANRAWARQLAAADVVLLNKIDLLASPSSATEAGAAGDAARERLEAARAFVRKWAPEARVVETTRGRAPLPSILDVTLAPQPEGKFGHDWDSAARPFLLSPTGGGLRKDTRVTDDSVTDPKTDPKTGGPFVIRPARRRSTRPSRARTAPARGAAAFGSARVRVRRGAARVVPAVGRAWDPAQRRARQGVRHVPGGPRGDVRLPPLGEAPRRDRARAGDSSRIPRATARRRGATKTNAARAHRAGAWTPPRRSMRSERCARFRTATVTARLPKTSRRYLPKTSPRGTRRWRSAQVGARSSRRTRAWSCARITILLSPPVRRGARGVRALPPDWRGAQRHELRDHGARARRGLQPRQRRVRAR